MYFKNNYYGGLALHYFPMTLPSSSAFGGDVDTFIHVVELHLLPT